jgi:hypothetical protein
MTLNLAVVSASRYLRRRVNHTVVNIIVVNIIVVINAVVDLTIVSTPLPFLLASRHRITQCMMRSTAETRDSRIIALESVRKQEHNGTLTKALADGFLWRLEQAVRNGVIPEKDPVSTTILRRIHTKRTATARRIQTTETKMRTTLPIRTLSPQDMVTAPTRDIGSSSAKSFRRAARRNTRRISDAALVDLLTGTTTRIEKVKLIKQPAACDKCIGNLYLQHRLMLARSACSKLGSASSCVSTLTYGILLCSAWIDSAIDCGLRSRVK